MGSIPWTQHRWDVLASTVWGAISQAAAPAGSRVAVLGIGGLGHLAVQYAKAVGYETVAITHSADKHKLATSLGADLVVSDADGLREAAGQTSSS